MVRLSVGRYVLLLLNLSLFALLAVSVAHWTWVFLAPGTMATVPDEEGSVHPVQAIVQAHLFQSADVSAVSGNVVLEAVLADEPSHAGYAIVTMNGKTQTVASGEHLAPDLVLQAVYPHHVVLLQQGAPMVVRLHETLAEAPVSVVPASSVMPLSEASSSVAPLPMAHVFVPHRARYAP